QPHIQFHISLQFRKEASSQLSIHSCQVMCFIISINNGFLILHENVKLIRVLGLGYEWKDGEGINKSPQKAQWHKLKRKLQDLWLGVNTIDARAGKEFILHAATLMGNQFLFPDGYASNLATCITQLCARTLNAIWLDSIYSEGIGLHTKKKYMKRWFGINNLWLNVREIEGRRIVELWLMAHIMEKILNFMTLADIGQWFYFGVIGLIRKHQPCIYQISHLWNKMKHFCNMLLCIYKENKASFHMFYQEEGDNYLLFYSSLAINFGARNTRTLPTSPIQAEVIDATNAWFFIIGFNEVAEKKRVGTNVCLECNVSFSWENCSLLALFENLLWHVLLNVLPSNECVACCHAVRNETSIILMLGASNMISKNFYCQEQQAQAVHFQAHQKLFSGQQEFQHTYYLPSLNIYVTQYKIIEVILF
ncbi:hypothetical protein ACJX0J_016660, partial [Zea mays]